MSLEIISDLRTMRPQVINSYQGAFGPPTQGHYQAMMFSARAHLKRYPDGLIVMLFMPTAQSSSKPHLFPTQAVRLQMLNRYCMKLQDTLALEGVLDNRIKFIASDLEYKLSNEGKSTSTIHTITTLKTVGCDITLTMGLDNLFDLPYWDRVAEYKDILANPAIYTPQRRISDEEASKLITPYESRKMIRFLPQASFAPSKKWELISDEIKTSLHILKDRIQLLDYPLPTSSTLLRCALYKLYGKTDGEWNKQYVNHVQILEGFRPSLEDEWHRFFQIVRPYIIKSCESRNFDNNFLKAGFKGGNRRNTRRKRQMRSSRLRIKN